MAAEPEPPPLVDVSELIASAPRALLEAMLASVADAVYLVDPDGRVQFVNPAGLAVLGYDDASELLGRVSHPTIHYKRPDGTPFPDAECPMLRPRVTGETIRIDEDWFVRRDGTMVPVAYSSAPFPMDGRRGAVVAFRDISERLAAEGARRREAVDHARLQEVQASRARIVVAQDAARRQLGRDLHDGAQQRLVHVLLKLQLVQTRLGGADWEAMEATAVALAETRAALEELRDLANGIHPAILSNRGLGAAVESLTARARLPVTVDVPAGRWPEGIEVAAYFVVSEALANVAKHAPDATEAWVTVTAAGGTLTVEIADDGAGGVDLDAGSGLRGLEDRLAALDGTLVVDGPRPGGTRVTATLPV